MRALAIAAVACMHAGYVWRFTGNTQCRRARPRVNSTRVGLAASSDEQRKAAAAITRAAVSVSASFLRRPKCVLFYFLVLVCRFWDSRISAYSFSPPVEITTRGMLGASGKFKH